MDNKPFSSHFLCFFCEKFLYSKNSPKTLSAITFSMTMFSSFFSIKKYFYSFLTAFFQYKKDLIMWWNVKLNVQRSANNDQKRDPSWYFAFWPINLIKTIKKDRGDVSNALFRVSLLFLGFAILFKAKDNIWARLVKSFAKKSCLLGQH